MRHRQPSAAQMLPARKKIGILEKRNGLDFFAEQRERAAMDLFQVAAVNEFRDWRLALSPSFLRVNSVEGLEIGDWNDFA